jgi:hypothetical protein
MGNRAGQKAQSRPARDRADSPDRLIPICRRSVADGWLENSNVFQQTSPEKTDSEKPAPKMNQQTENAKVRHRGGKKSRVSCADPEKAVTKMNQQTENGQDIIAGAKKEWMFCADPDKPGPKNGPTN